MSRLKESLIKTTKNVTTQLSGMFMAFTGANEDFFNELEDVMILADLGVVTSANAVEKLREITYREGFRTGSQIKDALTDILTDILDVGDYGLKLTTKPSIILVIGVNGVGKTTTIGKLAHRYMNEGKKVLLCAGDTFRAAAGEQLAIWAKQAGAELVRRDDGADPASVVFDGINAAVARGADIIICDTAGRLHNKSNLMNELNKISRIIDRELPYADKETLLVLDATTGQNGLIQAVKFKDTASITGIVLTKLDGTAKGGIVFSIANELRVPVKLVGVGEKPEDLVDFNPREFTEAILL